LTPEGAQVLRAERCDVAVERGAGAASGFPDEDYRAAGAGIVSPAEAWAADLVVKVKEPAPPEFPFLSESSALFTFLHLAAFPELTKELLARRVTAVAYETVTSGGTLPILRPMSEVAGALSIQVGSRGLEKACGGRGVLLPGASGSPPGNVCVLGAGVAGRAAARIAAGIGASVTILDLNPEKLSLAEEEGIVHYCVPNMPAAVPRTSTRALAAVTLPYLLSFARKGVVGALRADGGLLSGLNTRDGHVTCAGVAKAFGLPFVPPRKAIG
jgi:alanine dehydrogenase